jgi:hypothetical protein
MTQTKRTHKRTWIEWTAVGGALLTVLARPAPDNPGPEPQGEPLARADRTQLIKSLGTGIYVWHMEQVGSPRQLARLAESTGIASVYLKATDGSRTFCDVERLHQTARELGKRGIKTLLWGYTRATDPDQEAELIIELLHSDRHLGGYMFDVEDPACATQGAQQRLVQLLATVRKHRDRCPECQDKLLGCCVPAAIHRHPAIPYTLLLRIADFYSPMMYAQDMKLSVSRCIARTFQEFSALERETGLRTPMVPLGQSYAGAGGPRPGDIAVFARRTRGYFSIAFWDFESAVRDGLLPDIAQAAGVRGQQSKARPIDR